MRQRLLVSALLSIALLCTVASVAANDRRFAIDLTAIDEAGSQSEMNMAAAAEARRAEDVMKDMLDQIHREYKDEPLFLGKLDEAQKAWLVFREAHLESLYPAEEKQYEYGSVFPMCYWLEWAALTWERVKQLNEWVEGVPEGTLGAGSRKWSE